MGNQRFIDRLKPGPRDFQQLLKKRIEKNHPDEPQERVAAILEKVRALDAEITGRNR